jgi:hypothetical protein
MRLLNFKCDCGNEDEVYATTEKIENEIYKDFKCSICGKTSTPFNIKRNSQTWKYNDVRSDK